MPPNSRCGKSSSLAAIVPFRCGSVRDRSERPALAVYHHCGATALWHVLAGWIGTRRTCHPAVRLPRVVRHRKRVTGMSLALESRHCGSVYVVRCAGRIVTGDESAVLEEALKRGLREFTPVVLDVAEVDHVDSSGMGLLVRFLWHTRTRGGDLRLCRSLAVCDQAAGDDQALFGVPHLSRRRGRHRVVPERGLP